MTSAAGVACRPALSGAKRVQQLDEPLTRVPFGVGAVLG
jgi:hypothetical protein